MTMTAGQQFIPVDWVLMLTMLGIIALALATSYLYFRWANWDAERHIRRMQKRKRESQSSEEAIQ